MVACLSVQSLRVKVVAIYLQIQSENATQPAELFNESQGFESDAAPAISLLEIQFIHDGRWTPEFQAEAESYRNVSDAVLVLSNPPDSSG